MKFERTWTGNWENAFRGLRHPMESYAKSDSNFGFCEAFDEEEDVVINSDNNIFEVASIGPNDLDLAQRMIKAGTPNDKFLRQIPISVDITAPLYWWKEMDTYKVGTVANSTSTMHKLASTPINMDCFETDDYDKEFEILPETELVEDDSYIIQMRYTIDDFTSGIIQDLELLRQKYFETKDKRYWKELIRWLPEGWLQTRTWTANYAVLRNIIHWRQGHKLTEWQSFIDWCHTLPYAEELLFYNNTKNS